MLIAAYRILVLGKLGRWVAAQAHFLEFELVVVAVGNAYASTVVAPQLQHQWTPHPRSCS